MIKNVIFDIGKVLVDFNWDDFMQKIFDGNNDLIGKLAEAVWGDSRWDKLDWGAELEDVIMSMVNHDPEHETELRYMFSRIGECVGRREYAIPWIEELKSRGKKVYYLSNYSHTVMNANPGCLDFLPYMDGGVFSCDVHMLKPDREIYECIAKKYNLVPSECVFIDDLERNVKGAEDFGFRGIRFITLEQTKKDLNTMLGEDRA